MAIFAQIFFLLSTAATKPSILVFYLRLLDRSINPHLVFAVYAGIAFTIAYMLAILIFLGTFCTPAAASWQSLDLSYSKEFKCASRAISDPLAGILSAAGDIWALTIPEIIVAQLKLPQRRKLVLYAIFGVGAVFIVAALIRTGYFVHFHAEPLRDLTCKVPSGLRMRCATCHRDCLRCVRLDYSRAVIRADICLHTSFEKRGLIPRLRPRREQSQLLFR